MATILHETHNLSLGGPREYRCEYDVGAPFPVTTLVRQTRRSNKSNDLKWEALAVASPSPFEKKMWICELSRGEMNVRSNDAKVLTPDEYLDACRKDAALLAERAESTLCAYEPGLLHATVPQDARSARGQRRSKRRADS